MKLIIILLAVFSLVSCKDENRNLELEATENTTKNIENRADTAHNSQNSLDWTGVYKGILPCKDCDGIETSIQLDENLDYVLSQHYLDSAEAEENNIKETGKFTWNKEENTLSLGERKKLYFKVSENYMLQVFRDESKVMGDSAVKYRLTKTSSL